MRLFNIKSVLFILLSMIVLTSCSDDDSVALVSFSSPDLEVVTDTLTPVTVNFEISPASPQDSNIRIIAPQAAYGNSFITEPPLSAGEINVPVSAGATSASFELILIESGIGFEDFIQDFEIIAVGPGLATNEFDGRYFSFNLVNERVQEDDLPFVENFGVCGPNGSFELPPEEWTIIDVAQNSFGTGGFFCYTGQGVTGVGTNPFTPAGEATSGDDYSESWLISPSISLGGAVDPSLSFNFDRRFDAPIDENTLAYGLQISTDYDGTNFDTANWEVFQPAVDAMTANDPGFDGISNTGELSLAQYEGEDISIAFIYRAVDAYFQATSIRISDVLVE
ncbi:MAG: choice-of-anchor J domain-containing protein [Psychroflexus sp.]